MRYRKPFTPKQRQQALRVCLSLRSQLNTIRTKFRPKNAEQREAVRQLRQALDEFVATLRSPDVTLDTARLNELEERATLLGLRYAWLRGTLS